MVAVSTSNGVQVIVAKEICVAGGVDVAKGHLSGVKVGVKVGRLVAIGMPSNWAIFASELLKVVGMMEDSSSNKKNTAPMITFKINKYAINVAHCHVWNLYFFNRLNYNVGSICTGSLCAKKQQNLKSNCLEEKTFNRLIDRAFASRSQTEVWEREWPPQAFSCWNDLI